MCSFDEVFLIGSNQKTNMNSHMNYIISEHFNIPYLELWGNIRKPQTPKLHTCLLWMSLTEQKVYWFFSECHSFTFLNLDTWCYNKHWYCTKITIIGIILIDAVHKLHLFFLTAGFKKYISSHLPKVL